MKTCLLFNSRASGWDRWWPRLSPLADETGSLLLRDASQQPLEELLAEVRRTGCSRVIVAGGDGTLSRLVNYAVPFFDDLEFALIPTGTGNDFARSLGLFGYPMEDVWEWAISRQARAIDLLKVSHGETSWVVNAMTAGFGGAVSTDVTSGDKHRWGAMAYWMTAFSRLTTLQQFDIQLELDSDRVSLQAYGLAVANGRFVGGGFPVAPAAIVNDGVADVTLVPVLPPLELLAAGVDFAMGRHSPHEGVETRRTRWARIHAEPTLPCSLDGEPIRSIDATIEIVPRAMHFVCGPHASSVRLDPGGGHDALDVGEKKSAGPDLPLPRPDLA